MGLSDRLLWATGWLAPIKNEPARDNVLPEQTRDLYGRPLTSDFSSWRDYRALSGKARSWKKDRPRKDIFEHDIVFDINLTRVDKLNSSVRKQL
jgi:hypothetical protein